MSELDDAVAVPIIENVRGEQVTFPPLLLEDYGAIERKVREERRAHFLKMLQECGLQGNDKFVAMRDGLSPWVNELQVAGYLCTFDGAKCAVKLSLEHGGMTNEQSDKIVKSYQFRDLANLALALVGFADRVRVNQPGDGKGKAEYPTDPTSAPAQSTSPATGAVSQP